MTFWKKKRVLVTGAGGFIGSHLAERLVQDGAAVRAMTHYNALGSNQWLDRSPFASEMELIAGDITDADSVRMAVDNVEVVFHLAALIGIPYSYHAPEAYVKTNVLGTLNVLRATRASSSVCRLVHTSTSEVYGTAKYVPIDEEHPLRGQSPYSASKIGADKMAEAFHLSFDVPLVTVRPFNTFGPRQSARAVIPAIVTQCLTGDTVKLGNLTPTRDMNFVANTVDGFIKAAEHDAAVGGTFNIGSGREISISALAELIIQMTGGSAEIVQDDERFRPEGSEVDRLLADCSRAKQLLEWAPSVTLEDGLRTTIEWIQVHMDRYRPHLYSL